MEYQGFTLDPFQERAIRHLQEGRSVLVSAPTGTGKTIVADHLVEEALGRGGQVIYTAPVKALSNQKYRDWCRLHGEENIGLVTGDLVIRRDAPCRVMTTEILRNMLLSGEEMPELEAVILDEIHFLGDRERGTAWEEVLIYLSSTVQVLGLSATLSNLDEFADWLTEVRGARVEVVEEHKRSVPLSISLYNQEVGLKSPEPFETAWRTHSGKSKGRGGGRSDRGRSQRRQGRDSRPKPTSHIRVIRDLTPDYLPILYFVFSRRNAEAFARSLGKGQRRSFLSGRESEAMRERLDEAEAELGERVLDHNLRRLYEQGIGFHHAGLHVQLKALVEGLYERKLLKVLYTTSTFALGINMPARTVVLDGIRKFNGQDVLPLTVQQFMQKAGRAGRRGMDDLGQVVIRMDFWDYKQARPDVQRYLSGKSERVTSAFNLSFNSVVNLLDRQTPEAIRELVGQSFLGFHLSRVSEGHEEKLAAMEAELREEGWTPKMSDPPRHLRQKARELRRLRRRGDRAADRVWQDFEIRRQYLQRIGYIAEDESFNAGARVLQKIQIEEIFTTELVLSGLLLDVEPDLMFGLFTAMTGNLPRSARTYSKLRGPGRDVVIAIDKLRSTPVIVDAESITEQEVTWDPALVIFGMGWAEGKSLAELVDGIQSETDLSGQLVSNFRRAKDLVTQIRAACLEDEPFAQMLRDLAKKVSRDEVEVVG